MAEVQLSTVVDLDLVKMKWREQYVSEGLNRKIVPSQPPGIYQGLRIVENISSPRQVELAPDVDTNYHMAVYQSTTGYSLTYWDPAGTSIILDLSSTDLNDQETVIGLEMDYQIGVDTTAKWMAFPIADWNALPAARKNEIVVLGTVQVPLLTSTNIVSGDISFERATYAWTGLSKGALPWSPVVRNGGFEQSIDASTRALYCDLSASNGTGSGTVLVSIVNPYAHEKAVRFATVSSGSMTLEAQQSIAIPVTPGQLVMVRGKKQQFLVPSSGTVDINIAFSSGSGTTASTVTLDFGGTTVDGSYEDVLHVFEVPANVYAMETITIGGTVSYGSSPNTAIDIDDIQVWVETQGNMSEQSGQVSGDMEVRGKLKFTRAGLSYSSLDNQTIEALGGSDMQCNAGSFRVPSGELRAGTWLRAGQAELGQDFRSTIANALLPRVKMQAAHSSTSDYTLLGEFDNGIGDQLSRLYVRYDGSLVWTRNAWWSSSSLWQKDSDGAAAIYFTIRTASVQNFPGLLMKTRGLTSNGTWDDTSWTYEEGLVVKIAQGGGTGLRNDAGDGYMATNYLYAAENKTATFSNTNTLYANNIVKAWGRVTAGEFTGPVLRDGFNVSSITDLGSTFQVNLAASMNDANYCIVGTMAQGLGDGGTNTLDSFITVTAQSASAFTLEAISHSGTIQSIAGGLDSSVYFVVLGLQ